MNFQEASVRLERRETKKIDPNPMSIGEGIWTKTIVMQDIRRSGYMILPMRSFLI